MYGDSSFARRQRRSGVARLGQGRDHLYQIGVASARVAGHRCHATFQVDRNRVHTGHLLQSACDRSDARPTAHAVNFQLDGLHILIAFKVWMPNVGPPACEARYQEPILSGGVKTGVDVDQLSVAPCFSPTTSTSGRCLT